MTPSDARGLPRNLDAERSVLGAILLDNQAINPATEILTADDFFGETHAPIFTAMVALSDENQAIDPVTLAEALTHADNLDNAVDLAYLSALMDGLPRALNTAQYARIVKEKASSRTLIALADSVIKSAMNGRHDLGQHTETLSNHLREVVRIERNEIDWRTAAEIGQDASEGPSPIVPGYIYAGAITDLAGPPKVSGKTTFAIHLAGAVIYGNPFLGRPTKQGPVVYLTEETPTTFEQALRRANLLGCEDFHILSRKDVIGMPWPDIMAAGVSKAQDVGAVVIVVDTAPSFMGLAGEDENSSGAVLEALKPLQSAADEGLGVLANRHERKSGGAVGIAGRGSSAYTGVVDIVLALRRPQGGTRPGVRELHGLSRFDDTPDLLMVEFTKDGYVAHGTAAAVALDEAVRALEQTAPRSKADASSLNDLLSNVGDGISRPTLQRAADKLLEEGVLTRTGSGVRGDPFKFFLIKHLHLIDKKENGWRDG